ncbi:hypothetical protein QQ045_031106 [Rhodiola kirilowii]
MVGNALIDYMHDSVGTYQYLWSLGLISNQMYIQLNKTCAVDSTYLFKSPECKKNIHNSGKEIGKIDRYSIFTGTRTCQTSATKNHTIQRSLVAGDQCDAYDPCTDTYSTRYFNLPAVRKALHVRPESKQPWAGCRQEIRDNWKDNSISVLDIYHESIQAGIRIWVISGNTDSIVPVTATRYNLDALNLRAVSPYRPWTVDGQVGGWVQNYDGLTLVVVNGAGHLIPKSKPKEALAVLKAFLSGK